MATPKLRFKEFDGDWSNKKIGNIASKVGSGSTPRGGAEAYTDHGIIFIRSQNVNNDQLLLDDVAYIPEETHVKMSGSKVIANDILLNITGASIGRSCVVPHDFTEANVNQHVCIIRTPNDDPIFVQSFLSSENGQNAIQSKQAGGGREGLNFQAIRSIDFHFPPSKEEQAKIASFLSNVDKKISQLTQKHALLSQYKQGMMQKLFSQQLRFKADNGSEFGEWEEKELHQIFQIKAGGDIEKSSVSEVRTSEFSYPIFANSDKNKGFYGWANKFKYKEAVTVTGRGNLGIAVARNEPFYPIVRLLVLLPLVKQNLKFFEEQINLLDIVSESTGVPQLTAPQLSKYKVNVPSLEEQTKIATFLSAIDQKIEVVAQQIEQAKQWKKGLLQQMFV